MKNGLVAVAVLYHGQAAFIPLDFGKAQYLLGAAVKQAQLAVAPAVQQVMPGMEVDREDVFRRGMEGVNHPLAISEMGFLAVAAQVLRPVVGPFGAEQPGQGGGGTVSPVQGQRQHSRQGQHRPDLEEVAGRHVDRLAGFATELAVTAGFFHRRGGGRFMGAVFVPSGQGEEAGQHHGPA